jgi:hypothetical protein
MDEPRGQTPTITHFYKILYSSIQHTPKFNWKALAMLRISSDFVLASCGRRCVFILIFDYINGYSVWFKKKLDILCDTIYLYMPSSLQKRIISGHLFMVARRTGSYVHLLVIFKQNILFKNLKQNTLSKKLLPPYQNICRCWFFHATLIIRLIQKHYRKNVKR